MNLSILKKGRRRKKKIWLKGGKIRCIVLWITGRLHGKNELLTKSEEGWRSPFLDRKYRDYGNYAARIWDETNNQLNSIRKEMIQLWKMQEDLRQHQNKETRKEEASSYGLARKWREQRREEERKSNLNEQEEKICRQLLELEELLNASEAETEEMLSAARYRLESKITWYFQGAKRYLKEHPCVPLLEAAEPYKIYENRNRENLLIRRNIVSDEGGEKDVQMEK